jgi:hypothetical protein
VYKVLGVRSAHPEGGYVSWVKNDVNQFGLYLFPLTLSRRRLDAQYARTRVETSKAP